MMYFKDSMQDLHTHILFQCDFELPFHAVLKNSKQMRMNFKTKRVFIRSSDRAIQMKQFLYLKLTEQRILRKLTQPIDIFVNAQFLFYFPVDEFYTKKGEISKKLADLSNLYCGPEDALQATNIITNDRLIRHHNGSDRLVSDDGKYHLSILLTRCEQYETMKTKPPPKKGSKSWIHG